MTAVLDLEIANVVGGEARRPRGERSYVRENPARSSETLATYALASPADVDDAVEAARGAFRDWRRTPPLARGTVLRRAAVLLRERLNALADLMQTEIGKIRAEAEGELQAAANLLDLYAGESSRFGGEALQAAEAHTHLYTERRPLGVCGLITPWNYPVSIPVWKIAPALLCGDTVVWKPALQHPRLSQAVAALFSEAGAPPGVVNLVHGDGPDVGQAIVDHPDVAAISFTGSREVGHAVYRNASRRHARASCEMGGKNALVVMPDADPQLAVECAFAGGMDFGGQKCTGTDRLFVHDEVREPFVQSLHQRLGALVVGDPRRDGVHYGPLIDGLQAERVEAMLARAAEAGANVERGAAPPDGGHYLAPALVLDADPHSEIACDEIFGPALVVSGFNDLDAAIDAVNATEYGLSASICTTSLSAAHRFVDGAETGLAYVNRPTSGAEFHAPFGGIKASGLGVSEQGLKVLEFYSRWRTVAMRTA